MDIQAEVERARQATSDKNYSEAFAIAKAALKEIETKTMDSQDLRTRLDILEILALSSKWMGHHVNSVMYYGHLVKGAEKINDQELKARTLTELAFVYMRMGKREKAMENLEDAEKLVRNFHNPEIYIKILSGKAIIHWRSGRNPEAIEIAEKSLEMADKYEEWQLAGNSASVLSAAYNELVNYDKALEYCDRAIGYYGKEGLDISIAQMYNNQGEYLKRMKEFERAIESYEKGLSMLAEQNTREAGYMLTNLAECQARVGLEKEAGDTLEKAEKVLKGSEDKYAVACLWFVKGLFEELQGNIDRAQDIFRKAEKRMSDLDIPYDTGIIQFELAKSYQNDGNVAAAEQMMYKAQESFKKSGSLGLTRQG